MNTATKKTLAHASHYHLKSIGTAQETPVATTRLQAHSSQRKTAGNFDATLASVTYPMSAPRRLFSKFIHLKGVEITSDIVGGTIARPNALLSGAVFAFVLTLGTYLLAKNLGYSLSGFETMSAFMFGWLLGLVYDFLKLMVTGKR